MKIFVIHSLAMPKQALGHAEKLEKEGHETFVPCRDTPQIDTTREDILKSNKAGMKWCQITHVFWNLSSLGTIFDIGMAYALGKPVHVIDVRKHHFATYMAENVGERIF